MVESTTFHRYLLEDIMGAPVNKNWIVLVSTKHPFYGSYLNLSQNAVPLPLKYIHGIPFIQLKAIVTANCQYKNLSRGLISNTYYLGTEMGLNGNGAVLLPFIGAGVSLQVL
jgi:hypothetical protein